MLNHVFLPFPGFDPSWLSWAPLHYLLSISFLLSTSKFKSSTSIQSSILFPQCSSLNQKVKHSVYDTTPSQIKVLSGRQNSSPPLNFAVAVLPLIFWSHLNSLVNMRFKYLYLSTSYIYFSILLASYLLHHLFSSLYSLPTSHHFTFFPTLQLFHPLSCSITLAQLMYLYGCCVKR